jgi:hypothetical protein
MRREIASPSVRNDGKIISFDASLLWQIGVSTL